jgi:hypothetical protein
MCVRRAWLPGTHCHQNHHHKQRHGVDDSGDLPDNNDNDDDDDDDDDDDTPAVCYKHIQQHGHVVTVRTACKHSKSACCTRPR